MLKILKVLCLLLVAWLAGALAEAGAPLLAQTPAPPTAPSVDPVVAARGKALFESNSCFDCHRIGDKGSRLGPDLSIIGMGRTPERLRQALVAPDEEVLGENRFIRLVTKDGATVTGRLLNQDAISVQFIDAKEQLRSFLRAGLREYTILDKGLMPSVQGKLTDAQVADLVSYLTSLRN